MDKINYREIIDKTDIISRDVWTVNNETIPIEINLNISYNMFKKAIDEYFRIVMPKTPNGDYVYNADLVDVARWYITIHYFTNLSSDIFSNNEIDGYIFYNYDALIELWEVGFCGDLRSIIEHNIAYSKCYAKLFEAIHYTSEKIKAEQHDLIAAFSRYLNHAEHNMRNAQPEDLDIMKELVNKLNTVKDTDLVEAMRKIAKKH